jgi:hypothetical protein
MPFWLGNKITENQWKIAETIYTPFAKGQLLDFFSRGLLKLVI